MQSFDYLLEIIAFIGILAMVGVSLYCYTALPEQIPIHFGPSGMPDKWGTKSHLWLLPVLGTVIYGFMSFINRYPHQFNYMVKITPENAERQYTMATRMLRFVKAFIALLFAYLTIRTIQIALGDSSGLSHWVLIVPLITLGVTFWYIGRSTSKN